MKSVNSYLGNLEQQLLDAHAALVRESALISARNQKQISRRRPQKVVIDGSDR